MSIITWLFILLLFIFILSIFFNKLYFNPYRLYLVFGKKGSGKSTYLVKLALKYQKKGYNIYTNIDDCMLSGVRLFDVKRLGDFVPAQNSLLLIDEVGMIWDSRDFKNFKPSVRDFFKLQRHYHVICYLASQTFDIDKKLRDLTDGMILFVNVMSVFSVGKTITKKIVLTESTSDSESRISENLKFKPIWDWKFTYIPKYQKYFNSFKVPDLPSLPYHEYVQPDVNLVDQASDIELFVPDSYDLPLTFFEKVSAYYNTYISPKLNKIFIFHLKK